MKERRWFVLRIIPQGEPRATKWLVNGWTKGRKLIEELFSPKEFKQVRKNQFTHNRHRRKDITKPILPGYMFIKLDELETEIDWPAIERTPGVAGYLSLDGETKATVSENMIETLRELEHALNNPKPIDKKWPFKPGDKVELVDNPISGAQFVLKRLDKQDRAVLEVMLPGRASTLHVAAQRLKAVS